MRYMGWTWAEYESTPAYVIAHLMAKLEESQKDKGASMGPRDTRELEHH
jgi:hypothetical protein